MFVKSCDEQSSYSPGLNELMTYVRGGSSPKAQQKLSYQVSRYPLLSDATVELRHTLRHEPELVHQLPYLQQAFGEGVEAGLHYAAARPTVPAWRHRFQASLVAAAVMLLLLAIPQRWLHQRSVAPPRAALNLLTPPPASTTRGVSSLDAQQLKQALYLYHQKEYQPAEQQLGQLLGKPDLSQELSQQARYYRGICFLWLGKPAQAEICLRSVAQTAQDTWQEEGQYYLGWALLRQGKVDEARQTLEPLTGHANPFQQQARRMLTLLQ